ncbi:hypothetical protein [Xylella fastidiosa]|uniref:hypothetical protein n=1 Tax=Xylella fastidiosa TaxID=2371 RepID=UPI000FFE35A9|nr:hypothetical protein [Xylella fastidiosa]RWA32160.1 hypothetical protein XfCFBP7969_11330 [Xylella fastidiosa subsp. fastidiosa]UIT40330.1 hypothetical protein LZ759_05765 [Xylella fastidiosa subsp. multiplex]
MSTLTNTNEKTQPSQATSAPTEAPPLDLGGLEDAKILALLEGFHIKEAKGLEGTLEILSFKDKRFSPLMRSWFKGRQDSEIGFSFGGGQECIRVRPTHPLYWHVCTVYTVNGLIAQITELRLEAKASAEAAKKGSEDASKEVAA